MFADHDTQRASISSLKKCSDRFLFEEGIEETMVNEDVLKAFFKAENERDWAAYRQFLHTEVSWKLFDKEEKVINGIQSYMQVIKRAYENTDIQFSCQDMLISNGGNRIIAYLINDLGLRSLDIFVFKDNLIYREYEFILD